jgi:cell division protein FtsW
MSRHRIPLTENATGQGLVLTSIALLSLGVVMVYSALSSVTPPGAWYSRVDVRHTIFAGLAAVVLLTLWRLDYHWLGAGKSVWLSPAAALLALAIVACVLVHVPGIGHKVGGDARWIRIGPDQYSIGFQPSELIKVALLIFLAVWLSRDAVNVRSFWRTFVPACALIGACALLVIKEDFSTGVLVGLAALLVLFIAGVPWWQLALFVPAGAAAVYFLVVQTPHRWARIAAFLQLSANDLRNQEMLQNPQVYQPWQALLAIISGGWTGKGIGQGQLKHGFLPEDTTDFIFAVYCEEWGALGALLLIGLVGMFAWHARKAAMRAPDRLGALLAASLGLVIVLAALMHIAVDLGAVPATGQGFPFVSAGGTALLISACAVAGIVSVSARGRPEEKAQKSVQPAGQQAASPT